MKNLILHASFVDKEQANAGNPMEDDALTEDTTSAKQVQDCEQARWACRKK